MICIDALTKHILVCKREVLRECTRAGSCWQNSLSGGSKAKFSLCVSLRHNCMWVVVMNEANVHALINLALHGVNCSASRAGRFTPGERGQPARQTNRQPARQTDSQPDRQTDSQTDSQPARQTDSSQTDRQAGKQTESRTDRQTTCRFLQFALFCPVAPLTLRHDSSSCYGCRKQTEDREAAVNK